MSLKPRVFVSNFPFAREDKRPLEMLHEQGFEVVVNPLGRKLKPEETAEMALDCDGIIAGTENLEPLIRASNRLRFISRIGIGLDSVPLKLCRQKKIEVAYTPDAVTPAVSELTIGLMVSSTRFVVQSDREIREGKWTRTYGKRIEKSVIGIIGFGRVGYQVARLLVPFNPVKVLVNDIADVGSKISALRENGLNIEHADKDAIFKESDLVTLHLPLSPLTARIINNESIALMKSGGFLINTSRGGLINEDHLYKALSEKKLAGAALDVFCHEPYTGKFSGLDNVVLTQHIGSCSYDCRVEMETQAADSIVRFFTGKPVERIVPETEYSYQNQFP